MSSGKKWVRILKTVDKFGMIKMKKKKKEELTRDTY